MTRRLAIIATCATVLLGGSALALMHPPGAAAPPAYKARLVPPSSWMDVRDELVPTAILRSPPPGRWFKIELLRREVEYLERLERERR